MAHRFSFLDYEKTLEMLKRSGKEGMFDFGDVPVINDFDNFLLSAYYQIAMSSSEDSLKYSEMLCFLNHKKIVQIDVFVSLFTIIHNKVLSERMKYEKANDTRRTIRQI